MRVVSVNVGEPRKVVWRGKMVRTGIFKAPAAGPVALRRLNLDSDRQADLSVHGGAAKAIYAYPVEHYAFWEAALGRRLEWGSFGENLTVEGLPLDGELFLGDRIRVGSAELAVTQPRLPCFKLGIRFDDPLMVRRFLEAGRTGYYLRVRREGTVEAGDDAVLVERDPAAVPVSEITRVYARERDDAVGLRRVLAAAALPDDWRPYFSELLARAETEGTRSRRARAAPRS